MEAGREREARRAAEAAVGWRVHVRGVVQGVGFRPFCARLAGAFGLTGRVRNAGDGVTIDVFGAPGRLAAWRERLALDKPDAARIDAISTTSLAGAPPAAFTIAPSLSAPAAGALPVAPDLATCEDCLADLRDPASRRAGDPFVGCARCGPRFSVLRALPFDRARTTLAAFVRCAACEAEYANPDDRRFHAQTISCPACGPRLALLDGGGAPLAEGARAIAGAARALRDGRILAVLGIGGFHLVCDARNREAITTLRARKQRARKPFAVMLRDVAAADALAELDAAARQLLASPERPILLARRRGANADADAGRGAGEIADEVAPGSPLVGLLLPYTGLQWLLLEAVGGPLVTTSGNRSGEPLAHDVADGLRRLGKIADAFLVHDRVIVTALDDSIATLVAGAPTWLRRSRGLVPSALRLARPLAQPVLAAGGQLHNTVCLAAGDRAHLSRHHGDLDTPEACDAFASSIDQLVSLIGVAPRAIAHDLHPLYRTTRWALSQTGLPTIGVQHHHAHVASVLAEHGRSGPVFGLAFDGTGHGTDGAAWGGELLLADLAGFRRLATLRPLRLAGGERAIREVWRLALAILDDAFDGAAPWERLPLARTVAPTRVDAVRGLLRARTLCVPAHGAGRWFDAVGALALGRPEADFQGEIALAWNHAAHRRPAAAYPFDVDLGRDPWQLDLRPCVRAIVGDVLGGVAVDEISARFHATLAAGAAAWLREATRRHGPHPVALAGGCFQNDLLVRRVLGALAGSAPVLRAQCVPPGDGGLALGQAVVADATLRGERSHACA